MAHGSLLGCSVDTMFFERPQLRARSIALNNFLCVGTAMGTRFQRAWNHSKRVVDDVTVATNVTKKKVTNLKIIVHWARSTP